MRLLFVSATMILPLRSRATPEGLENEALIPAPSAYAKEPLPAIVDTAPPGVTLRMRLLSRSATMTLPLKSKATLKGLLKDAAVPVPSAYPYEPLPASVLTTPPGVTTRMRWLYMSATMMLPLGSRATPEGLLKDAPVPLPSANELHPLPASVLTFHWQGGCAGSPATTHAVAG